MRDYGTGQWEGGEAGCSHEVGRFTYAHSDKQGSNSGSAGHKAHDICPHCGAHRIDRQLGREASPDEYVAQMVAVFREVWRVLRSDGTVWLVIADSYSSGNSGQRVRNTSGGFAGGDGKRTQPATQANPGSPPVKGMKPKDLVGIPWRVAFALQAEGWYLRSDIIWHKPNPMPESVTDRPTKAHEYVFLLAKSRRYYYDAEAVREAHKRTYDFADWETRKVHGATGGCMDRGARQQQGDGCSHDLGSGNGRNKRSVWTVTTKPYKGAHFATFPPALVEPMVLAGTSAKGCCPECGKPWERVVERTAINHISRHDRQTVTGGAISGGVGKNFPDVTLQTIGWVPGCDCCDLPGDVSIESAGLSPVPCTVLDPFGGTMTVGQVCAKHGRRFVGLDLKREYVEMGRERCANVQTAMPL